MTLQTFRRLAVLMLFLACARAAAAAGDGVFRPQAAPAAAEGWQPRGLFGGIVDQIDVSPGYAANGTLFVTGIRGEIFRSLVGATGGTTGGVYLSGDGGEHWTQINQGFDPNNLSITSLITTSCSGCPVQYYSGSFGGGLYTRTISVVAPPAFPVANNSCYGVTNCACATGGGSGPEQGGQAFKLCGSNFQNGAIVEFDGIAASGCVFVNSGTRTCTAIPPHAPSVVSIRVRNPDTRVGYLPALYTYTTGTPRASNLLVVKSSVDAALSWNCLNTSCTAAAPARVYRSQNALFSLYVENYNGGPSAGNAGAYTNTGAVSSGQNYFWSVE